MEITTTLAEASQEMVKLQPEVKISQRLTGVQVFGEDRIKSFLEFLRSKSIKARSPVPVTEEGNYSYAGKFTDHEMVLIRQYLRDNNFRIEILEDD